MKFRLLMTLSLLTSFNLWAESVAYQVPVEDARLAPYSHFTVNVVCDVMGDKRIITYNYPKELTGVTQAIELEQSAIDPRLYAGEKGEMRCDSESCDVKLKNLSINRLALKVRLNQISRDKEEFDARMQLAILNLGGEPGGIMGENPTSIAPLIIRR